MVGKVLKGPPLTAEVPKKTVGQYFFDSAEKFKGNICQIDGENDVKETYQSIKEKSVRIAIEMRKRGVTSEDIILNCSRATLSSTLPVLATQFLGAKIANIDPSLSVRDTKCILALIRPRMIFLEECASQLIEDALMDQGLHPEIVIDGNSQKYSQLEDFLKISDEESSFEPAEVPLAKTAFMLFTSGTTGVPKAICLSHKTLLYSTGNTGQTAVVLAFSSLHWLSATWVLLGSFGVGGTRILVTSFSAEKFFRLVEKYKVMVSIVAPVGTFSLTTFKDADKYDTSSLLALLMGGSAVSAEHVVNLRKTLKCLILYGYGITETGAVSSFNPYIDMQLLMARPGSSGKPTAGVELKIVDPETNQILGPNQKGEIYVKTQTMMNGYYNIDSREYFDQDGFFKSGDVGYYDEDECLYVVERIKDIFKYQAWQIVPASLEAILQQHPAVKEAVVFGLPDEVDGDRPAAAVVLVDGLNPSVEEIKRFLAERVLDREQLRGGLAIVKSFPKTPSNKIVRHRVRDLYTKDLV